MSKYRIFLLSIILIGLGCNNIKDEKVISSDQTELSNNLNEYFLTLKKLKKFNGAVLVQQNKEIIHFETYQMDNSEGSSLSINKQSQFDIHSISKLMAKAIVIDLEQENLLSSKDVISKFIKNYPDGHKITIQHLIENQSGLPRRFSQKINNLIDKTPEELISLITKEELLFEPGTETLYSNLGYQLLYYIIAKVADKPFVQVLNEKYFEPLKMKKTGAHFHLEKNNLKTLVKNHELDDDQIVVVPSIQSSDKNQAKLFSTVEDLLLFLEFIKKEPYKTKLTNVDRNVIGWSGGGDGILSHVEYNITGNYEVVFFSNYDAIPFGNIIKTVEKIMTKQPYKLPKKINRKAKNISENILKRYEGKYRVRAFNNQIFEYRIENGKLVMYQEGERGGALKAETDSTFFDVPDAEDYFEFRKVNDDNYKLIFHYKTIELEGKKEADK